METQRRPSSVSATSTWESTFPGDFAIEKNSTIFAHRFIKTATSFILDKRGLFDKQGDGFFKNRTIDRLLISVFDNAKSQVLVAKIDALKEAIEKKYLREFAIVFYQKPDEEDVLEVFSFRLMYGEEGDITMQLNSCIGTEESNRDLLEARFTNVNTTRINFTDTIKKLHRAMKQLDNLPADADASFRVSFTDSAPANYMPRGYDTTPNFYDMDSAERKGHFTVASGGHHKVQIVAASRLWKAGALDFNQTLNSTQSIQIPRKKTARGAQKKQARAEVRAPYGRSSTMNSGSQPSPN